MKQGQKDIKHGGSVSQASFKIIVNSVTHFLGFADNGKCQVV